MKEFPRFQQVHNEMHEIHNIFVDLWDGVCVEMDEFDIFQQVHYEMHALALCR